MQHGTRPCYQAGCRCLPCRVANSRYVLGYRSLKAHGKQPLGALMSAGETKRLIRQFIGAGFTRTEIAVALGLRTPQVRLHTRVSLRKALRIKRLFRLKVAS